MSVVPVRIGWEAAVGCRLSAGGHLLGCHRLHRAETPVDDQELERAAGVTLWSLRPKHRKGGESAPA